ncbi:hypothetical protein JKA74_04435 [Marivirga sp. S37H4]|uniref:Seryl-tRNA synthetase n=1 Tax=Marivirga aurantiaca TaxID=2802615 RepID=A0A934WWI0_9BACT|nr:hypothetical protein [Marivirga aurantiaca]MBK6264274.1 hypothetical protein [Marivirga aurantiaca]
MKKLTIGLLTACLLVIVSPIQTSANSGAETPTENTATPAHVTSLLNRLDEINNLSKEGMSREEKKELRKEVKSIKKELKATGNGVYLSVGAIIIIVLLLILLL